MNQLERHRELLQLAERAVPRHGGGESLFLAPWQARVFALIVAVVRNGHFDWIAFQQHLVHELAQEKADGPSDVEIERHYFDAWLRAAEYTLCDRGFIRSDEVESQIESIHASVKEIRDRQLGLRQE